tara:strand:+ start:755 stop:1624 length:870 start_codon:yes stop_codon:yes gene_type:complete
MIENLRKRYADLQGLLNTPIGQSEGGLLSNIPQSAILGSAIYGQGIQGKDPFAALLPATLQTAQLQKYITPKKGFKILSKEEAKKEIPNADPNKTYQKNMETKQVSVIGGGGININTANPAKVPLDIRQQYETESKDFKKRKDNRNAILSNLNVKFDDRSAVDDFSAIYKYYKFLDPNSVVKESEFKTLEEVGGVADRIRAIVPKFTRGNRLTKNQVTGLKNAMEREFPGYVKDQTTRENTFKKLMEQGGFDSSVIQTYLDDEQMPSKDTKNSLQNLSTEQLIKILNNL